MIFVKFKYSLNINTRSANILDENLNNSSKSYNFVRFYIIKYLI